MSRYRDDDDSDRPPPSTAPDRRSRPSISRSDVTDLVHRKTESILTLQQDKIALFLEERDRSAEKRARRDRDLKDTLDALDGKVSDLYSRDAYDVDTLSRFMTEMNAFKTDLLLQMKDLTLERQRVVGRVEGVRWTIVAAGAIVGVAWPVVTWLLAKIH